MGIALVGAVRQGHGEPERRLPLLPSPLGGEDLDQGPHLVPGLMEGVLA
jgi:hypothetical protein